MNLDYNLIGVRVATLRCERKWTQKELAERCGLAQNYLSNIENNHSIPSLETLTKICIALDVTPNQLLLGAAKQETNYLNNDFAELFSQCTPQEKRCILRFIEVMIEERNRGNTK